MNGDLMMKLKNENSYFFFLLLMTILTTNNFAQTSTATIIKSPNDFPKDDSRLKIFLGGTIEMGNSVDWQAQLTSELENQHIILLNPRRDDWNKEWKQVSSDTNFHQQVSWELTALEYADIIVMYFAPNSQSPISLLEFGLYAKTNKLLVVCPEGFWRKGNVDIVSERYNIKKFNTLKELTDALKKIILERHK